jgi:3-dehydroquinate synthase
MTSSASLFERVATERKAIFARTTDALVPVISESCRIKAAIVAADERESGPRRILNFGHTAGHALEAVTRYRRFRHGEAVGYGMLVACELAKARGALAERDGQALADLMMDAMRHDKKMVAGQLNFVLPTMIGATAIVDDVTEKEMRTALKRVGFGD